MNGNPEGMMVGPGDVFETATGRKTSPVPNFKLDTDRRVSRALKLIGVWLLENAIAEAESRGDDFNLLIFKGMGPLAGADSDTLHMYLFDKELAEKIRVAIRGSLVLRDLNGNVQAEETG